MCQDAIFLYGDCEKANYHTTYLGLGTRTLLDIVSPQEDSPEIGRMCAKRLGKCRRTGIWRWCKKEDRAKRFLVGNMLPNARTAGRSARLRRRISLTNDGFRLAGGCYGIKCETRTKTFSDADWFRSDSLPESTIRSDLARRVGEMKIVTDNYTEEKTRISDRNYFVIVRHHKNGDLEKYLDSGYFYQDSAFEQSAEDSHEEGAAVGESSAAGAVRQSVDHSGQQTSFPQQGTGANHDHFAGSLTAQSPEFHISPLDISSDEEQPAVANQPVSQVNPANGEESGSDPGSDEDGEDEDGEDEDSEDEDSSEEELEELNAQFGG